MRCTCAGVVSLWLVVLVLLAGCGPVASQRQRWDWVPYEANEYTQQRDNVTVEMHKLPAIPPEFFATVQSCNGLSPLVDSTGKPVMERITLVPVGHTIDKVTLTNNTEHVIRLNRAVLRLFDPTGNQFEPLDYEQMQASLLAARPCGTTASIAPQLRLIKIFSRNVEIPPGTNFTGYLVFHPTTIEMTGTWKLGLYDIPVKTNDAGKVTKTTRFEIRSVVKHYVDHYTQGNPFAPAVLKSSEEVQ